MHKTGTIYGINGPVIYLKGNTGFQMAEMVYVGKERLVGEVIRLTNDITTIQVFEETTGLRPGDPVAEIVIVISAVDIEKNKIRGDLGITYDTDVLRLKIGRAHV